MRMIFKYTLISIFMVVLAGCEQKPKFNRVDAFSQYAPVPEYTPYSKNIKKQTISEYQNGALISITTVCADEKGRTTKSEIKNLISEKRSSYQTMDFDKLKFNIEYPLYSIFIRDGNIILDDQGRVSKGISKEGEYTHLYNYRDNRIVSQSMLSSNLKMQLDLFWENNLVIKTTNLLSNASHGTVMETDISYNYDNNNRLILEKGTFNILNIEMDFVTSFYEWNDFGDWTKSKIMLKIPKSNEIITETTREIEYW